MHQTRERLNALMMMMMSGWTMMMKFFASRDVRHIQFKCIGIYFMRVFFRGVLYVCVCVCVAFARC